MRKGFTLAELMVAVLIMGLLIVGAMTVFASSMRSFYQTQTDIDLTTENTLGMQRVADTLRGAYSMEVLDGGTTVSYFLPLMSNVVDPVTGQIEIDDPLQSDGVERWFVVENGVLISRGAAGNSNFNQELVENIILIDPEPNSSQYNQTYAPFQLTTIGSRRALTINFITQDQVLGEPRYVRMKTTVIIRNSL